MEYDCHMEDTDIQITISIRTTTSVDRLFKELDHHRLKISKYLNERGQSPSGPPFAIYYNWDLKNLDIEIGYPLSQMSTNSPLAHCLKGEYHLSEIPPGKKASTIYKGPYKKIGPAYKALRTFMEERGYQPGINMEYYYNSPNEVPESELITKVVYFVK